MLLPLSVYWSGISHVGSNIVMKDPGKCKNYFMTALVSASNISVLLNMKYYF